MAQLCTKCSRANPAEAVYCYYDGFVLGGHERSGGPVAVGAKPFSSPFVFPTGRNCRTFDELALACQEEWKTACKLLKDGYLESFLGGLGRVDLALAAKEASRFPDVERGLDQLLAKLPSSVLNDPKLRIEPLDVNLGVLDGEGGSGKERTFDLEMENQGMRLLYGTATSDAVWLTLGDAGASEKHFHFTNEARIKVHVRPELVRAGSKPVEAKILVESNGGSQTVVVRGQKPVKPFPDGALKGVKTPRQVAEKAQAHPKEVAPLFETGEVARWYASNGWTYPVKLPAASGPAAIQQFFEALGVTRPPKVDISHREINLQGKPGDKLPVSFEVSTQEKRPVFAHVTSNVPWLEVSKARFNGRIAVVNMSVPTVPNRPGETLKGELTVISNGNQRFLVPVRLVVGGKAVAAAAAAFDFDAPAPPPPPPPPQSSSLVFNEEKPRTSHAPPPPISSPRRRPRPRPIWMHLIPALLLALAVLGVIGFDLATKSGRAGDGGNPVVASAGSGVGPGANYDPKTLTDKNEKIGVQFDDEWRRFGVVMLNTDDPNNRGRAKRLTFDDAGKTNNTIVKIASNEYYFGFTTGHNAFLPSDRLTKLPAPYKGWTSTFNFRSEKVLVQQYLQIVPSGTGKLDTLLIYYHVKNDGTLPQKVALRIMLDTFIGANDGVPFTVPGQPGFVSTKTTLTGSNIPDYLEVVENPDDERNPGTIARLGLRGLDWSDKFKLLPVEKVVISRFPGDRARWDWPLEDMKDPDGSGDSSVAVYWPEQTIEPKKSKHMAITYGLGSLQISENLGLSGPATAAPNREFTVTAYVYNAKSGQTVELEPPPGVQVVGNRSVKITEDAKRTQVFWKVKASKEGPAKFGATAGKSRASPITVKIQGKSIFG